MSVCQISVTFFLGSITLRICPIKSVEYAWLQKNFAASAHFFSLMFFSFSLLVCFLSTKSLWSKCRIYIKIKKKSDRLDCDNMSAFRNNVNRMLKLVNRLLFTIFWSSELIWGNRRVGKIRKVFFFFWRSHNALGKITPCSRDLTKVEAI